MHLSGRTNDIDLDIWPVLGMAQPAQHPRILEKEVLSKRGVKQASRERKLTMSVASISLVDAIKPSENAGSAVLSMRSMAGFAGASGISDDGAFRAPNRVML